MKYLIMVIVLGSIFSNGWSQSVVYNDYPVYEGNDLGLIYTNTASSFRIWAPFAERVRINLYEAGEGGVPLKKEKMKKGGDGTWVLTLKGDLAGKFYTF